MISTKTIPNFSQDKPFKIVTGARFIFKNNREFFIEQCYKNVTENNNLMSFNISYSGENNVVNGLSSYVKLDFNTAESFNHFSNLCSNFHFLKCDSPVIKKYPSNIIPLTYSIKLNQSNLDQCKADFVKILTAIHRFTPFDLKTLKEIYYWFELPGKTFVEIYQEQQLRSAFIRGGLMGLFGASKNPTLPVEMIGEIAQYVENPNVAFVSKLALETAKQAYQKEENNLQLKR